MSNCSSTRAAPLWFDGVAGRASAILEEQLGAASTPRDAAIFTVIGGPRYLAYLRPWAERLRTLAWDARVVAALDAPALAHARQVGSCLAVPAWHDVDALDAGASKAAALGQRIPPLVGVVKFLFVSLLLSRGFGSVTLAEMDVLMISDPWPSLKSSRLRHNIVGMENFPWDRNLNIGFFVVHNEPASRTLFEAVTRDWAATVEADPAEGRAVARDQFFFNHYLQDRGWRRCGVRAAALNRSAFATCNMVKRSSKTLRSVHNAELREATDLDSPRWRSVQGPGWQWVTDSSTPLIHLRRSVAVPRTQRAQPLEAANRARRAHIRRAALGAALTGCHRCPARAACRYCT